MELRNKGMRVGIREPGRTWEANATEQPASMHAPTVPRKQELWLFPASEEEPKLREVPRGTQLVNSRTHI